MLASIHLWITYTHCWTFSLVKLCAWKWVFFLLLLVEAKLRNRIEWGCSAMISIMLFTHRRKCISVASEQNDVNDALFSFGSRSINLCFSNIFSTACQKFKHHEYTSTNKRNHVIESEKKMKTGQNKAIRWRGVHTQQNGNKTKKKHATNMRRVKHQSKERVLAIQSKRYLFHCFESNATIDKLWYNRWYKILWHSTSCEVVCAPKTNRCH